MSEQHLDLFAITPGIFSGIGLGDLTRHVPGALMDRAAQTACRIDWAALGFQGTDRTFGFEAAIVARPILVDRSRSIAESALPWLEKLARRTDVNVLLMVKCEVAA